MTKKTMAVAIAALALTAAGAGTAAAGPGGRGGHGKHGKHGFHGGPGGHGEHRMIKRILDRLDLSEAQRAELRELRDQHRDAGRDRREAMVAARRKLADAILADTLDEAAVRAAAAEVARLEQELSLERARGFQQVRAVLTPEQRERFAELRRQAGERMDAWRERRDEREPRQGGGESEAF